MEDVINVVEREMGLENIFQGFMLNVDVDRNKGTVSLSFVSWILSLFGPDLIQKPWNYNVDFKTYMKNEGESVHLFHLKDARFGCLSKSAAVVYILGTTSSGFLTLTIILQINWHD